MLRRRRRRHGCRGRKQRSRGRLRDRDFRRDFQHGVSLKILLNGALGVRRDFHRRRGVEFAGNLAAKLGLRLDFQNGLVRQFARRTIRGGLCGLQLLRNRLSGVRQFYRRFHHLTQPLQGREVALAKRVHLA